MKRVNSKIGLVLMLVSLIACQKKESAYELTSNSPAEKDGYQLIWHDEFNTTGKPDSNYWSYEHGFVRNNELQWYQPENAYCANGVLVIVGKKEQVVNSAFDETSDDWRKSRQYAEYTSASINTSGKQSFQYGLVEVRARIDTALGMWPAIWTLGVSKPWPANGEIDIMEFYQVKDQGTILANAAWADAAGKAVWDEAKVPIPHFTEQDPDWPQKFHVWKMDWTESSIKFYLDDELLNEVDISKTLNPDGFNPFRQPHYLLLNLAIGSNGGDPSRTTFPKKYEVDYVRIYQKPSNS